MEPIGIIEKNSCNAQTSKFNYTNLYKDLSDGNVSPSSAHLDHTYFCNCSYSDSTPNCKCGDIFNTTKRITISPRTTKEKIQEKPLRHDKVQSDTYNDAINVNKNLINKETLFSNFTKVGYKNILEKSKSIDKKIPWKNFGSLHDISYQQKPTLLDTKFPNNDIRDVPNNNHNIKRNNSEKFHLYSLSNQDIKINVLPCEQNSNKKSRDSSRNLKTNDKTWDKQVPQDNNSLSGLIKEKTSIFLDYQNRRSRYTRSPTSNSFDEPGNQKYKSISTVRIEEPTMKSASSHNVPTKSFNDISVLYTDPPSVGPTDHRKHLSLSPTLGYFASTSYKKNSTLFVSNQLFQPRHSFSTSHGYHENEIQLNFRKLSEQIRSSCSSENLNTNKSKTRSKNIRQKSNDTISKTTPVSPNALLETRC